MDGALVLSPALRVASPDGHVDGAADLLVEQHVPRAPVDRVVGSDPELAEPPRPLVGVEQADQELLASFRRASTTLPDSNLSRTPATSRPPTIAGK